MDQSWKKLTGDGADELLNTNLTAAIATLVNPGEVAVRTERAIEVRSDSKRISLLLNPNVIVRGQPARSAVLITAFKAGLMEQADPTHPFLDCMAGLHNAAAILEWRQRSTYQVLKHNAGKTRTWYQPGAPPLATDVETVGTRRLAVAAALGRLGMPLYNVTGSGDTSEYIVHRWSQGMEDEEGMPIRYDARLLITGLNEDTLRHDHPFVLAYCARRNRDNLMVHIDREIPLLILTPDVIKKGAPYDPEGRHSYIHPNATGKTWDDQKKHFHG